MKKLIFILILSATSILSINAHAEFEEGKSAVLANLGFTRGGLALGADYEYGYHRTFGVGGYMRVYPGSTNPYAASVTAMGAFIRPHFSRQAWDFYLSPGFGFIQYDPKTSSSKTLLGPSFALGLLYEFNMRMSFGIEQMTLYSWFGEDSYRGTVPYGDSFLAKFRFMF